MAIWVIKAPQGLVSHPSTLLNRHGQTRFKMTMRCILRWGTRASGQGKGGRARGLALGLGLGLGLGSRLCGGGIAAHSMVHWAVDSVLAWNTPANTAWEVGLGL